MEFKFSMDVDTPKGKVSAIRKVIGMGMMSYEDRLALVSTIMGAVESPAPDQFAPMVGRVTVKPEAKAAREKELSERQLAEDKQEIESILYPNRKYNRTVRKIGEYGYIRKEVCTYDKNWNLVDTYPNKYEAAKALRCSVQVIERHCDLKIKGKFGFMLAIFRKEPRMELEREVFVRWKWDGAPPKW